MQVHLVHAELSADAVDPLGATRDTSGLAPCLIAPGSARVGGFEQNKVRATQLGRQDVCLMYNIYI